MALSIAQQQQRARRRQKVVDGFNGMTIGVILFYSHASFLRRVRPRPPVPAFLRGPTDVHRRAKLLFQRVRGTRFLYFPTLMGPRQHQKSALPQPSVWKICSSLYDNGRKRPCTMRPSRQDDDGGDEARLRQVVNAPPRVVLHVLPVSWSLSKIVILTGMKCRILEGASRLG